jgi:hypothetical protein
VRKVKGKAVWERIGVSAESVTPDIGHC